MTPGSQVAPAAMSTIASRRGADLSWSSSHRGLTRQPSLLVVVAEPQVAAARELSVSASGEPRSWSYAVRGRSGEPL